MSDIEELNSINHEYRKSLEAYAKRTGLAPQTVDQRGSGEEREKFAKMDADMDAAELRAQNLALEARLAKLERTPQFDNRASVKSSNPMDVDSAAYAERWLKAASSGNLAEFRVMIGGADGTSASANVALPTDLERRIINRLQQTAVLRSLAKISVIDSKRTIAVENALPASALVSENGSITAQDPTFATQINVTPYKFVCATTMTAEFMDDVIGNSGIGSGLDYVAGKIALSLGLILDQYYTVGTGASQPQGIADTSSTSWASTNSGNIINQGVQLAEDAAATAISTDNLIDCYHAVAPQYRQSPRFQWLVSDTVVKTIRKLKTTNGDYVWAMTPYINQQAAVGAPGTILGVPYSVAKYLNTTQTATTTANLRGEAYAICGNWDYFEIFDRTGMQSMLDPYSGAANMRSTLYTWMRTDSRIMLPEAFAAVYGLNAA